MCEYKSSKLEFKSSFFFLWIFKSSLVQRDALGCVVQLQTLITKKKWGRNLFSPCVRVFFFNRRNKNYSYNAQNVKVHYSCRHKKWIRGGPMPIVVGLRSPKFKTARYNYYSTSNGYTNFHLSLFIKKEK